MKKFKRIMALVIALAMVVAMTLPVFATGEGAGTPVATAPTTGTITINSPIVGATYKVYKVFDMTTNAAVDAFSYTIDEDSPFYGAVVQYASDPNNGLILTRIQNSDPATYNVSVSTKDNEPAGYKKFDAQAFGKAMQAVLETGSPDVEADAVETAKPGTGIVAKAAGSAIGEDYSKKCEVKDSQNENTSDQLVFDGVDEDGDGENDGIDLGYYLINPTYPEASAVTVTMGSDEDGNKQTFTEEDLVKNADGTVKVPRELVKPAGENTENEKIVAYANATVTDAYVNKYISDHGITTNKDGSPLNEAGKADYKADLIKAIKKDAEEKVLAAFNNNGSEADINVKEPILVFLDSSQPDAVINEKNEIDKWDVPVNPTGEVEPGTPDHGEPEGGKNIIVQEATESTPAYSADWSEAEIGESVHYQLRVNAMNFIRTGEKDDTIEQVKEYILADYQSAQMHFDQTKGLRVSVWQGNNNNDSQTDEKVNVTANAGLTDITKASYKANNGDPYLDYTAYATGELPNTFFKNNTEEDGTAATLNNDIFGEEGTGIVVPWVIVSEDANLKNTYPIYTVTNIPKVDGEENPVYKVETIKTDDEGNKIPYKEVNTEGNWVAIPNLYVSTDNHVVFSSDSSATTGNVVDTNEDGTLKTNTSGGYEFVQDTKPVYTYSIYNSDVTIVVDYWMILDDDAIVDEPGNKNFAQYGWSPVDNKNQDGSPKTPTNPDDEDTPSKKEKVDEATVYTFALAWVKVDEQGKALADATFKLPFYVKVDEETGKPVKDGNAYVFAFALKDEDGKYIEATDSTYPEDKSQDPDENGTYPKFTKNNTTNLVTTDATGVITIKGVEQDTYSITETEAPAGFNKLTTPIEVEAKKSGPAVTTKTKTIIYLDANGNVTETVTTATEEYETDEDSQVDNVPVYQFDPIVNKQGTELPSTGGIGTTIFYVIGAILVIGAGVILITRRRMDA